MADLSDVENAIRDTLASSLLLTGTDQHKLLDITCRIFRGWPSPGGLNADLIAGAVNITIFPDAGAGRTTTRFFDTWYSANTEPGLVLTERDGTVTVTGVPRDGQLVGIDVDGQTFVYSVKSSDTTSMVASALAALIRTDRVVNYARSELTIPGAVSIRARAGKDGIVQREVRRQERDIRVSCWCSSPSQRDTITSEIDGTLAALSFISLPDGSSGRITYVGSQVFDTSQNALLYRRDLIYTVNTQLSFRILRRHCFLGICI
jgi:hypothetical protein